MHKKLKKYQRLSETELLERHAQGDRLAFLALYLRYENKLMAFFIKVSHDEHIAKDLLQDTFVNLLNSKRFRQKSIQEFGKYLVRIAHNSWSAHLKREKQRNHNAVQWQIEQSNETCAPAHEPTEAQQQEANIISMERAIDQLSQRQKRAISLWAEGYTYQQIATTMSVTVAEVTGLIYRAKQNLGGILEL